MDGLPPAGAADAPDSAPDSRPAAADLVAVARSPVSATQRLYGGQSATTELVTTVYGQRAVHKTPKPHEDFEDTRFLMDGEELVSLLAQDVGAPVADVHRDGPASVWVEYIDGTPEGAERLIDSPGAIRIGLLDAMVGNHDRVGGLLVSDGRLVGFDHGGAWLPAELGDREPYLREPDAPMRHFVDGETGTWRDNPPITAAELAEIRHRVEARRPVFERAGRTAWLEYSLGVLDQITQRATRGPIGPPDRNDRVAQRTDAATVQITQAAADAAVRPVLDRDQTIEQADPACDPGEPGNVMLGRRLTEARQRLAAIRARRAERDEPGIEL